MDILQLSQEKERVFRITFPNGEVVLFKLLCWQDYKAFTKAFEKLVIPHDVLVDRLLKRCILDVSLLDTFDKKHAGIPYTIVDLIMCLSGPSSEPETFNQTLEFARQQVDTIESQIVMLICRAFPAYKPEELFLMKWSEVVLRLVQAERILINRGELTESIRMLTQQDIEQANKKQTLDIDKLVRDGPPREVEKPTRREPNPNQARQLNAVRALKQRQREMR